LYILYFAGIYKAEGTLVIYAVSPYLMLNKKYLGNVAMKEIRNDQQNGV
jgi:hypothetical protein